MPKNRDRVAAAAFEQGRMAVDSNGGLIYY
jgi:hypothetical protein